MLLRAGAALLHCYRDELVDSGSFQAVATTLQRIGRDLWHADRLIAAMYNKHRVSRRPQQKAALDTVRKERVAQRLAAAAGEARELVSRTAFTADDIRELLDCARRTFEAEGGAMARPSEACARESVLEALLANLAHVLYPDAAPLSAHRRARHSAGALFDVIAAKSISADFVPLDAMLVGLSTLCRASDEEALAYTFGAFDSDGDGDLTAVGCLLYTSPSPRD